MADPVPPIFSHASLQLNGVEGLADRNRRTTQAFLQALSGEGQAAAIERFMTDDVDYVVIPNASPELHRILPWIGRHEGKAAALRYDAWLRRNQQAEALDVELIVADGDTVVAFASVTAHAQSTGRRANWDVVFRLTFDREGRIARYQLYEDSYEPAALRRLQGSWLVEADGGTAIVACSAWPRRSARAPDAKFYQEIGSRETCVAGS